MIVVTYTDWTVRILAKDSREPDSAYLSEGTGFFFDADYLLTCYHVVPGGKGTLGRDFACRMPDGRLSRVSLVFEDKVNDVAVLRSDFPVENYASLRVLSNLQAHEPGDLFGYGFPGYQQETQSRPHCCPLGKLTPGSGAISSKPERLRADGSAEKGFSGGPVVAERHNGMQVIGMMQQGGQEKDKVYFISSHALAKLLARQGFVLPIIADGMETRRVVLPSDGQQFTDTYTQYYDHLDRSVSFAKFGLNLGPQPKFILFFYADAKGRWTPGYIQEFPLIEPVGDPPERYMPIVGLSPCRLRGVTRNTDVMDRFSIGLLNFDLLEAVLQALPASGYAKPSDVDNSRDLHTYYSPFNDRDDKIWPTPGPLEMTANKQNGMARALRWWGRDIQETEECHFDDQEGSSIVCARLGLTLSSTFAGALTR